MEPTFGDRTFTSYRIFSVEETTYVELVAPKETPEQSELAMRYSCGADGVWMDHEVAAGDPPFVAHPQTAKVLDGVMVALTALGEEWLQS